MVIKTTQTVLVLAMIVHMTRSISLGKMEEEASWTKAVSHYFSSNSLPSLVLGMIDPSLANLIQNPTHTDDRQTNRDDIDEKTIDLANIDLAESADWIVAFNKTLAKQSTYNTVINEVLKGITRIAGWLLLTLSLYGLEIFS